MALPEEKKAGGTALSRRIRKAGPVPSVVYGAQESLSEAERSALLSRLREDAGLSSDVNRISLSIGPISDDELFRRMVEALREHGVEIPMPPASLRVEVIDDLMAAYDKLVAELFVDPHPFRGFRDVFRSRICRLASDREALKKEKTISALTEVVSAAEAFRQAVSEGRLSCDEFPYVARKRISEIFQILDGKSVGDPDHEAELEAKLVAQQAEILHLRSAVPRVDVELAALEAEVAAMVEQGKAPEIYGERADRSENALSFLRRVYGKYLEKGSEAIYLFEIRKLDPKFVRSLTTACADAGMQVSSLVPLKSDKTDKIVRRLGIGKARQVSNALTAIKIRGLKK